MTDSSPHSGLRERALTWLRGRRSDDGETEDIINGLANSVETLATEAGELQEQYEGALKAAYDAEVVGDELRREKQALEEQLEATRASLEWRTAEFHSAVAHRRRVEAELEALRATLAEPSGRPAPSPASVLEGVETESGVYVDLAASVQPEVEGCTCLVYRDGLNQLTGKVRPNKSCPVHAPASSPKCARCGEPEDQHPWLADYASVGCLAFEEPSPARES